LIDDDGKEQQQLMGLLPRNFYFPNDISHYFYFVKFTKNSNEGMMEINC
jgi:hypothetical protein